MARRKGWRAVKSHYSYTVTEAARNQSVSVGTVRRWKKAGLECLTDQKPYLIRGKALVLFLKAMKPERAPMAADEFLCLRCRTPRKPAFSEAEFRPKARTYGKLTALCCQCGTLMHKNVSNATLDGLKQILKVTFPVGHAPLDKGTNPTSNDHLERKGQT